jgi:hypothetical protein
LPSRIESVIFINKKPGGDKMKKIFLEILCFLVIVLNVHGDTYVKIKYQCDGYYNYGNLVPAKNTLSEYWFGNKRMVLLTSRTKLILDVTKKKLWVVNIPNKLYVEIPLPLDLEKIIDGNVLKLFERDEAGGCVKATGETKKISHWECTGYKREFWVADQGSQYENRIETIWVTFDVTFDIELYHLLDSILVNLYGYVAHWDKQLVTDLKNFRGFPVAIYSRLYIKKTMRKAHQEIIEIVEKNPTPEVYSIPTDYKKKEKLIRHFFNPFPYHGDWGILDQ